MNAATELPRYRSHKEVWALKIKHIEPLPFVACGYVFGLTTCGFPEWECMHHDSPSEMIPPAGRHTFVGDKGIGAALITPEEDGYEPFPVSHDYLQKHDPKVGGYYVVYRDGYKSFSPASPFEQGYTRV